MHCIFIHERVSLGSIYGGREPDGENLTLLPVSVSVLYPSTEQQKVPGVKLQ